MKYISKYLMVIITIVSFAHIMPLLYGVALGQKVTNPYIVYSTIIDDFVFFVSDKSLQRKYYDVSGKEYTHREYSKIVPLMFYKDLEKWGEYPDTVAGKRISADEASKNRDFQNIYIKWIDASKVRVQLFPMFESQGESADLKMPAELFRIKSRMEFINAESNSIDEGKSVLFTNALKEANFAFPATIIAGNPTALKPYDFGYFVLDSKNKLFHIYQAKGLPVVKETGIAPDDGILYITVKESYFLDYYGLMVTNKGEIYHMMKDGYKTEKLSLGKYDPLNQGVRYSMDPLHITVKVFDEFGENIYVSDREHNAHKAYHYSYERKIRGGYSVVYNTIFPFIIKNNSDKAGYYIQLKASENYRYAFIFTIVMSVMYGMYRFTQKTERKFLAVDILLILIGGVYSLIALLLLDGVRRSSL